MQIPPVCKFLGKCIYDISWHDFVSDHRGLTLLCQGCKGISRYRCKSQQGLLRTCGGWALSSRGLLSMGAQLRERLVKCCCFIVKNRLLFATHVTSNRVSSSHVLAGHCPAAGCCRGGLHRGVGSHHLLVFLYRVAPHRGSSGHVVAGHRPAEEGQAEGSLYNCFFLHWNMYSFWLRIYVCIWQWIYIIYL